MIEFTPQTARLTTSPSGGTSGLGQGAAPVAGNPAFAAILASAAEPVSEALPSLAPPLDVANAAGPCPAPSADPSGLLPESGNILPGPQGVVAAAQSGDIAPAPQMADSARPVRNADPVPMPAPAGKPPKTDAASAAPIKAPAAKNAPQEADADEDAPVGDAVAALVLPTFIAVVAAPDAAPVPAAAGPALSSAPIPVQTGTQAVKAAATDLGAETRNLASAAAYPAAGNSASAGEATVQAKAQSVTNGTVARIAALDPRVFSLTLERETQGAVPPPASPAGPQPANAPTDQIIGQRDNRPQNLQALATLPASTLAVGANAEARPRPSSNASSALALAAEVDAEPDETAPFTPSLAPSAPLIANSPAPAAARGAAPAGERIDFAALVDSVARAREAGAGAQGVSASVTHAEFGKVSLRFQSEDAGLSVSMMSPDPGFAPAVAAARLADMAFGQGPSGQSLGQSSGQNSQGSGPQNQGQTTTSQSGAAPSGLAGDGSASGRGGSPQRQDAQHQGRNQMGRGDGLRASAATGDDLRRGAIWA
jgi:hypothetical protein